MNSLYLVRHGAVEKTGGRTYCLGRTDWPLSEEGKAQGRGLHRWFSGLNAACYTSPLSRCRETAHLMLKKEALADPRLAEMHMGAWDGLSFDDIRRLYPEAYRMRGENPAQHPPPGAEAPQAALERFDQAVRDDKECARVFVTHAGVLRLLFCHLTGKPPDDMFRVKLDYAGISLLNKTEAGWRVSGWNLRPAKTPAEAECEALLRGLPEPVAAHCRAVRVLALKMADTLAESGVLLDRGLLSAAALLHDVARLHRHHAQAGASKLRALGYEDVARVIAQHHDLTGESMDECAVLFLADTQTAGTQRVTIQERFKNSLQKCDTEEARQMHALRLRQAMETQARYERLILQKQREPLCGGALSEKRRRFEWESQGP